MSCILRYVLSREYSMYLLYSCPVGFFPPFAYRVFSFYSSQQHCFYSTKTILVHYFNADEFPKISGHARNIAQPFYPASC